MFIISNSVQDQGQDCLDVKMYDSFSPDENQLISHTRVFRDMDGRMNQRVLFDRKKIRSV